MGCRAPLDVRLASTSDANDDEWFDVVVSRSPRHQWTLTRRYSDFCELADAINSRHSHSPKLPSQPWWWSSWARRNKSREIGRRRLEHYLRSLLADERLREQEALLSFLGASEPVDALEKFPYTTRSGRGGQPRKPVEILVDVVSKHEKNSASSGVGERPGCDGLCLVM